MGAQAGSHLPGCGTRRIRCHSRGGRQGLHRNRRSVAAHPAARALGAATSAGRGDQRGGKCRRGAQCGRGSADGLGQRGRRRAGPDAGPWLRARVRRADAALGHRPGRVALSGDGLVRPAAVARDRAGHGWRRGHRLADDDGSQRTLAAAGPAAAAAATRRIGPDGRGAGDQRPCAVRLRIDGPAGRAAGLRQGRDGLPDGRRRAVAAGPLSPGNSLASSPTGPWSGWTAAARAASSPRTGPSS
ncbi:hypothetical protein MMB232_02147 [Brevundimonas subvibrioides]